MLKIFSLFIKIYEELYLLFCNMTGDYGFSLILLSLFTFLILLPFNRKAQQIQHKERKIQEILSPQIEDIKHTYAGQEQYEKLRRLYHRYAYHPFYAVRSVVSILFQLPFLATAYYMLTGLSEIQGVPWGLITNLGVPDHLLGGINLLPFIMTLVTVFYAFVLPEISKKERIQAAGIGILFLFLLYSAPSALLIFWTSNLFWSLLYSVLATRCRCIGEFIEENELAFHIIIALVLTIGLFVPLEIYIKNAGQLWFTLKDVLEYILCSSAKFSFVLLIIYFILWKDRIRIFYLSILSTSFI